jgi:hypothetical protein
MVLKSINCLLADGTTTKIDINFYTKFKKFNWCCNSDGYVMTKFKKNGKLYRIRLSHYVYDFDPEQNHGQVIDHKYLNPKDNRKKKLRKVSYSINSKNTIRQTNTGFRGISFNTKRNCYVVTYSQDNVKKAKNFYSGRNKPIEDAFYEAFEFNEHLRTTDPEYRFAYCLDEKDSSSGESIDEINYEFRINPDRLNINNTSKIKYISNIVSRNLFIVTYYNEQIKRTVKNFPYFPKSDDTEEEAKLKAIQFRDKMEQYRPKKMTKGISKEISDVRKQNNINGEGSLIDMELYENSDVIKKKYLTESDSDTITMSEDEIQREISISCNKGPFKDLCDMIILNK